MKILHLCQLDKFIPDFIDFTRAHTKEYEHLFITYNPFEDYPYKKSDDTLHIDNKIKRYWTIFISLYKSDKVMIHGLFDFYLMFMLALQPWLLKKCHWLVWGADLYRFDNKFKNKKSFKKLIRQFVIKNIGFIVTSVRGDYLNICNWYNAKGKHIPVYVYPASLFQVLDSKLLIKDDKVRVLAGNSADPSNNHRQIFEKLVQFELSNVEIIVPLSYGDDSYRNEVLKLGSDLLKGSFKPLIDYINYPEYLKILANVDIAIFNHGRQQAMSTTRVLLGMGKKVYMKEGTSSYEQLRDFGVVTYSLESFNFDQPLNQLNQNSKLIQSLYSENALKQNLHQLFGGK